MDKVICLATDTKPNKCRPQHCHTDGITTTTKGKGKKTSVIIDKNHSNHYHILKQQLKNIQKHTLSKQCDEAGSNLKQNKSKSSNRV